MSNVGYLIIYKTVCLNGHISCLNIYLHEENYDFLLRYNEGILNLPQESIHLLSSARDPSGGLLYDTCSCVLIMTDSINLKMKVN